MIDRQIDLQRWELYKAGFYDQEIADFQGVSKKSIVSWRKCRNLPPNKTKEDNSFLLNAIKSAMFETQIEAS